MLTRFAIEVGVTETAEFEALDLYSLFSAIDERTSQGLIFLQVKNLALLKLKYFGFRMGVFHQLGNLSIGKMPLF
jgi:hypothetical protein